MCYFLILLLLPLNYTSANAYIPGFIPIWDWIGICPPGDWRTSPVVEINRTIAERVCKVHGMPLIDTSDIMDVMWDRPRDWSHYDDDSSDVEAMYITRTIFQ